MSMARLFTPSGQLYAVLEINGCPDVIRVGEPSVMADQGHISRIRSFRREEIWFTNAGERPIANDDCVVTDVWIEEA